MMREDIQKFLGAKSSSIIPNGSEQEMPGLLLHIHITPALQDKLQGWVEKSGFPLTELGNLVARIGLLGVSTLIDSEENRIQPSDVGSFFYDQSKE